MMKQIFLRICAAFAATGLSVVGAGAIAGIPLWKAVMMAGIGGVSFVIEGLIRFACVFINFNCGTIQPSAEASRGVS